MKYSQIIYWNQFSGLTERFTARDMKNAKEIQVYGHVYSTEPIIEDILLEGEHIFSIHENDDQQTLYDLLFVPKMRKGRIRMALRVRLEKRTEDYLDVSVAESLDGDEYVLIGWIKVVKHIDGPINGIDGKAAIIIHDVGTLLGSNAANAALGTMAMAFGSYLLGIKDGDWQRVGKSYKDMLGKEEPKSEIEKLKAENVTLKNQLADAKRVQESVLRERDQKIETLQRDLKRVTRELNKQKDENVRLTKQLKRDKVASETPMLPKRNFLKELKKFFAQHKACFVGGSDKWQARAKKEFSSASFLKSKTFDESLVQDAEYLVVNTLATGHDIVIRATNIAQSHETKVLYTSKSNQESMAQELLKQIGI